ncbi:hypothetical protein HAX54_003392 [Datura stramonium]|uniref:Uncharacterized protein n=1 Tax=Datura stramonium TaxID=4076 RepID=A0ABS8WW35_DATST|nr:hypothetical protein [Datura stramonium]
MLKWNIGLSLRLPLELARSREHVYAGERLTDMSNSVLYFHRYARMVMGSRSKATNSRIVHSSKTMLRGTLRGTGHHIYPFFVSFSLTLESKYQIAFVLMEKKMVVPNEPLEEPSALAKKSKGKLVVEESSKGKDYGKEAEGNTKSDQMFNNS